jgi:Zn-dependent M32 family carboxypeptidase
MWETCRAFLRFGAVLSILQAFFPAQLGIVDWILFTQGSTRWSRLDRVEADDATYNLAFMLPLELEHRVDGRLPAR